MNISKIDPRTTVTIATDSTNRQLDSFQVRSLMSHYVAVISTSQDVKIVRTCLESGSLFNRNIKITRWSSPKDLRSNSECFAIPTVIRASSFDVPSSTALRDDGYTEKILRACEPYLSRDTIQNLTFGTVEASSGAGTEQHFQNSLHNAVAESIRQLDSSFVSLQLPDVKDLLSALPKAYSVYPPLLLLPHHAFESALWKDFFACFHSLGDTAEDFFSHLAAEMHVTHIALNAPIPAHVPPDPTYSGERMEENVMRSPTNLKTLYGDFGAFLPAFPKYKPNQSNLDQALWVETRQNGITQIWAPMYTMFSSGNVTEKARILHLNCVRDAVLRGNEGEGSSAVDLFAGIGYFAFSYAKAGISKVLCWDLNPWSVEGFKRGAVANKWPVCIFDDTSANETHITNACRGPERFLVFSESNANALVRITDMREVLPPIRHVNCGMLPSAKLVWKAAVEAIDHNLGGWIHLHETVFEHDIEERGRLIKEEIQKHLNLARGAPYEEKVVLEHIERVKTVGPRLLHVVLDIWIPPKAETIVSPN